MCPGCVQCVTHIPVTNTAVLASTFHSALSNWQHNLLLIKSDFEQTVEYTRTHKIIYNIKKFLKTQQTEEHTSFRTQQKTNIKLTSISLLNVNNTLGKAQWESNSDKMEYPSITTNTCLGHFLSWFQKVALSPWGRWSTCNTRSLQQSWLLVTGLLSREEFFSHKCQTT